jgi:hypothetical protein
MSQALNTRKLRKSVLLFSVNEMYEYFETSKAQDVLYEYSATLIDVKETSAFSPQNIYSIYLF